MAKKKKVKVGVLGAGGISQVSHIPNLIADKSAEVVAVCDLNPSRAALVSERFNIGAWYERPERMFKIENLDCVIIATPTISHLALCQLAFESGVDVLVEKPFARNAEEGKKIVKLADDSGRLLMVAMNHRFREDTSHLKQLLSDGDLGEVISLRVGWLKRIGVWGRPYWFTDPNLSGGGVMMDLGLQMIDLILYLLSAPKILDITGGMNQQTLELEVEDQASAFIRFSDNITCSIEVSWAHCEREDAAYFHIDTSHGSASLNPLRLTKRQASRVVEIVPEGMDDEVSLYRKSFSFELAHFIECVQNRTQPISSGRDAIAALEVIDRIYEASGF